MPAGASNLYVYSVRRLGLGSFNVFTTNLLVTLFFNFDNNDVSIVAPRLDVSIFYSLRSIMTIHYLFVFGFQGTYLSSSVYQFPDNSQWDS